ncbi:transcriptional repressor frmR [Streptococcus pneumoniae]|nr:transcriptional repressor frmR [Streptococcus pneumoniae]
MFTFIVYYDFIQLKVEEITMNYDKKMINRINRIQGQLNGVIKMMEEEKDCKDVITQISASKSSIQRLMGIIISENLIECVKAAEYNGENSEELINEAVNLLVKSK